MAKAKSFASQHVGEDGAEVAIGAGVGAVTGMVCKNVQRTMVNSAVLALGIAGGACLAGIVKPEDIKQRAQQYTSGIFGAAKANADVLFRDDANGDGRRDLEDSKLALSKFAKTHSHFSAGFLGGVIAGYKMG